MKKSKEEIKNEEFLKKLNTNINLLTRAAELTRRRGVPLKKSFCEQFLKGASEYIV